MDRHTSNPQFLGARAYRMRHLEAQVDHQSTATTADANEQADDARGCQFDFARIICGNALTGHAFARLCARIYCLTMSSFFTLTAPSVAPAILLAKSIWLWLLTNPVS